MKSYDENLNVLLDNYSLVESAKNEGRKEAMQEGIGEGASRRNVGIATKMIKMGLPVSDITQNLGSPIQEIEKL